MTTMTPRTSRTSKTKRAVVEPVAPAAPSAPSAKGRASRTAKEAQPAVVEPVVVATKPRGKRGSRAIAAPVVEAVPPKAEAKEKPRGVLHYIGLGLSMGVLLLVIAAGALLIVIPKLAGAIPLTVLTQSMEPLLPPGTLIVDRPVKIDQISPGDIVTYQIESGNPAVITHRVITVETSNTGKRSFIFKGDNNALPDTDKVLPVQIKGKLWYSIPWIGYVSNYMNGPARGQIVPIAATVLFLIAAWFFLGAAFQNLRKKRRGKTSDSAES
jgi:signal peptidase